MSRTTQEVVFILLKVVKMHEEKRPEGLTELTKLKTIISKLKDQYHNVICNDMILPLNAIIALRHNKFHCFPKTANNHILWFVGL